MTSINRLHYDFINEGNRSDSKYLKKTSAVQRDYYFNKAIVNLVQFYADLVEANDTVRQYLREITVRDKVLKGVDQGERYVAEYPKDFLKPIKVYIEASKAGCTERRRLLVRRMPSDKIERALKNTNTKRFWDFEETFGLESDKGFEIYQGDTKAERVVLDYIRKVKEVQGPEFEHAESYINAEGSKVTTNVDLELSHPDFVAKIGSLAVLFAHRDLGNITDYQTRYQSIVQFERVFN